MRASRVTVAPTAEPIDLETAKDHLRVTWDSEDRYIDSLIAAARNRVETFTRRALVNRTVETRFDGFCDSMWLPFPPLVSVSSITYIDGAGDSQTLATSVYDVDITSEPGRAWLKYGQTYPTPRAEPHAVRVTHVSGYGAAGSNVPQDLRHAVLLLVGNYYEHREAVIAGTTATAMPLSVESLLLPYVVWM